MIHKKAAALPALCFMAALLAITALDLLRPDRAFSAELKRPLAQRPTLSWQGLQNGSYTQAYQTYLDDQFIARPLLVEVSGRSQYLLGSRELKGVYLGRRQTLLPVPAAPDAQQLQKNSRRLAQFAGAMSQQLGAERVRVLLAPSAVRVWPQRLPAFAPGPQQEKELYQALTRDLPPGLTVDVCPQLVAHSDQPVYYYTDHHWTTLGAYYSYTVWAESMGFAPLSKDQITVTPSPHDFWGSSWSKVRLGGRPDKVELYTPRGLERCPVSVDGGASWQVGFYDLQKLGSGDDYGVFFGGNYPLVQVETGLDNGRRLLIVKDSFANCFAPLAAAHYQQLHMIDLRTFAGSVPQYVADHQITDLLVLYSTTGFADDRGTLALVR
ncbi:DHHW family protein [Neobittarella massiliensis]|uniref:DHHW family protein n=1 Tax=Neobittarella massiliensis (ex Bilen et al. 2018) TaxID=2041842 RepID=UPI000CF614BF|nr:DHHW family protein [Neobittarella massiliensis]